MRLLGSVTRTITIPHPLTSEIARLDTPAMASRHPESSSTTRSRSASAIGFRSALSAHSADTGSIEQACGLAMSRGGRLST
jgi:hypothetical protein